MFDKLTLATGVFALLLFAFAQQQGWNLFDNVANPSHGGSGSSRTYHK
ncbi:MAG: hypothetical protein IPF44_01295 [Betaproteobacteria bacterium]|jgi:hypothetical protein|nr:hypothetical protein [Betaproteobacteria bacterium]MBP6188835.1 hypothetical protein [Azonexus sp.]MBP6203059.1 hypothetical protein [Azonexus sp.]